MNHLNVDNLHADKQQGAYRDNFSRHLLGVARYMQSETMATLQQDCGHSSLRLGFAPYLTLINRQGVRMSDLAEVLLISRQACNQAANQIEAAGYIERLSDPKDGRAKRVSLTLRGLRLREDGVKIAAKLDNSFTRMVGQPAMLDAGKAVKKLYAGLDLGPARENVPTAASPSMSALLPRLADYTLQRLMTLTMAKGHPGLKLSFGQVLTLIGPEGGRITDIARIQHVSKQAISAIATELEALGYLYREVDPADARQLLLRFSDRGRALISDSVASVDTLEEEFIQITGKVATTRLKSTLRRLYRELQLEEDVFNNGTATSIELIAEGIKQQLGVAGSRALARLLLAPVHKEN